jgi:hypothetical protein
VQVYTALAYSSALCAPIGAARALRAPQPRASARALTLSRPPPHSLRLFFFPPGPALIPRINAGLAELLARDGHTSVAQAVGKEAASKWGGGAPLQ